MEKKTIFIVLMIFLIIISIIYIFILSNKFKVTSEILPPIKQNPTTNRTIDEQMFYYGPVPEGYNQTHYWETGEMKLNGK